MSSHLRHKFSRRSLLKTTAGSLAAIAVARHARAGGPSAPALAPTAFTLLPLGAIRPAGWLKRQLQVQADGQGGHLDEFWPDLMPNSAWLGGTGEAFERGPYFLDGLVPLAYLLDDAGLKAKAQKWVDWTLNNQQPNGMIGPAKNNDWWPRMVMVKALAQYLEATGDPRVTPVMTKYFHHQLEEMPSRPLASWGMYRWQDEAYVVQWLYERTHDPKLLQLSALLEKQGYSWQAQFEDFQYTTATPKSFFHKPEGQRDPAMQTHGVNNSQGLKAPAVQYRLTGDTAQHAAFVRQMGALDQYHGEPNGMFSCDEHLGGTEPQHGTELCSVVETMYSLEIVMATFGDATLGDRIEKIAFNALPGTFTDDMWAHQYDQQSNQIAVKVMDKSDLPWTDNGPFSNLYGLEPHFGCCTANFHQGWPKFTTSLWMKAPGDGLVAALYSPCDLHTTVGSTAVHIAEETEYPFKGSVKMTVTPEKPVAFPLMLRIPAWATNGVTMTVNGKPQKLEGAAGHFAKVDRTWAAGDTVELAFAMPVRATRWFNRSVALERGPLVFSLSPGESWTKLKDHGPTADWQVLRTKDWNYALAVDEAEAHKLAVTEHAVPARPFNSAGPAVTIDVPAHKLVSWQANQEGVATPPPASPVKDALAQQTLTFVPYGGAKLRVTAFPSVVS